MSRTWCLVVLVAAALLASPLSSIAQETRTQQIQLEQGWNLVSLNVQPDDSSFASIFGANVDQIAMVKNEEGEVYAPGESIEQITTWESSEGYQIHAKASLTLGVIGTPIRPDSMSIVLKKGGNVVPYLSSATQAAETAVSSLEGSLVLVEDEAGERYEPSASSSSLDSLRPGRAYKVYVDQPDTLRYPIVVPTLAEARGLKEVEVGKTIQVQGYHEPQDGGGGTFRVTGSGVETDGGTVFVFNEDVSGEKSQEISGWDSWNLPQSDLIWGTLDVRYGPDPEDVLSGLDMHGHTRNQVVFNGSAGWVDHGSGTIYAGGNALKNLNQDFGDGSQEYTVTYKHATSDRRLERVHPPGVFNLAWWGAPKADPDNPVSSTPYINWAVNTAKERYLEGGVEWSYVDIAGEYYYLHHTQILDGVMLRGAGEERPVPNRSFTTRGKLTLMPGEAVYTQKNDYDPIADHDEYAYLGGATRSTFGHETGASEKLGIQNLEIDGNLDQNEQVFTTDNYDNIEDWLQNSGDWAAWYTTGAGGQSYEKGLEVWINDVYAHGYGGNIFAGAGAEFQPNGTEFDVTGPGGVSKNVKVKDAIRNHQIYGLAGNMEDWSVAGAYWAGPMKIGSKSERPTTYTNLVVEEAPANPYGYNTRGILNVMGYNVVFDGFTFDLSETGGTESIQRIFSDQRGIYFDEEGGNVYKDGLIKLSPERSIALTSNASPHAPITFKNVTVEDNGGGVVLGKNFSNHSYNYVFENFEVVPKGGASGGASPMMGFEAQGDGTATKNIPTATRNIFRNFSYDVKFGGVLVAIDGNNPTAPSEAHPHDQFVIDSNINTVDGGRFVQYRRDEGEASAKAFYNLFLDNTTLNSIDFQYDTIHKFTGDYGLLRMRDAQTGSGLVSDETGSYTSDAGDEGNDYVLIPTALMSRAYETDATVTTGNRTAQSIEIANSDGTLRPDGNTGQKEPYLKVNLDAAIQAGNTITVDYTARVTPSDHYQTTGLFVTRPVSDQSFTSGDGPSAIDLRGVATTQEVRDKVVYTASSGDTSVVTANVQSDDYTLELTEQGTGTATITVTGTIDGVGTTTDTFQVTIE